MEVVGGGGVREGSLIEKTGLIKDSFYTLLGLAEYNLL